MSFIYPAKRSKLIDSLKVGDILSTKVSELIANNEAVINIDGNLIRVRNQSDLKVDDTFLVRVAELYPNMVFEKLENNSNLDFRTSTFKTVC